jgi:hypothetical protein
VIETGPPVMVNCKLIYLFVVVLKVKGPALIIPSNIYGTTVTPDTLTILLSCAIVAPSSSVILIICIVPVTPADAYITL